MDDWHPIETAPKDGRQILVRKPSRYYGGQECFVVSWDSDYRKWAVNAGAGEENFYEPITDWMPLPAPPVIQP